MGVRTAEGSEEDPPEIVIGERLFMETRFAQFFAKHLKDINEPLVTGDPVMDLTLTTGEALPGPFKGMSMNCRACHLVDEHKEAKNGGMRTYADFVRRSPIPSREDGKNLALRNSPPQVNASIEREFLFSHFDAEFVTMEDLVKATLTGRNFGWLPREEREAYTHIARVIRADNGKFPFPPPEDFGERYDKILRGDDPNFPLPEIYRIDVAKASDVEVVDAVAKLIAVYVTDLKFSQDEDDHGYNGSPYDAFLRKNGLPIAPGNGETPLQYSRRLRGMLEQARDWQFVTPKDGTFKTHKQDFVFGETELAGLKIFLRQPRTKGNSQELASSGSIGNCIACHPAPHFTDFLFHNTGVSQEEYDSVHGPGEFGKIKIPDYHQRQQNYFSHGPV